MKDLLNRLRLWFRLGKNCRHCCLICEYFDECSYDFNSEEKENGVASQED